MTVGRGKGEVVREGNRGYERCWIGMVLRREIQGNK